MCWAIGTISQVKNAEFSSLKNMFSPSSRSTAWPPGSTPPSSIRPRRPGSTLWGAGRTGRSRWWTTRSGTSHLGKYGAQHLSKICFNSPQSGACPCATTTASPSRTTLPRTSWGCSRRRGCSVSTRKRFIFYVKLWFFPLFNYFRRMFSSFPGCFKIFLFQSEELFL